MAMPFFLKVRSNCCEMSSSSLGTMRGRYSTTVTWVPMALYTYANSTPMAPDPTMTMDLGCLGKVMASRYPMIFTPSCFKAGNSRDRPPVAIRMFLPL